MWISRTNSPKNRPPNILFMEHSKSILNITNKGNKWENKSMKLHLLLASIPSSQGATDSFSLADLSIVSGNGNECRTMAPYSPYSAMIVLRPQHFSVLRHFARRFWNQTCKYKERPEIRNYNSYYSNIIIIWLLNVSEKAYLYIYSSSTEND